VRLSDGDGHLHRCQPGVRAACPRDVFPVSRCRPEQTMRVGPVTDWRDASVVVAALVSWRPGDQGTGTPSKYARAFCHTSAPIRLPSLESLTRIDARRAHVIELRFWGAEC
jgi:hypothetical protein